MAAKKPIDLVPGDVLADGFEITRGPSAPDFRNEVRVWGKEHDGTRGTRDLNITREVEQQ